LHIFCGSKKAGKIIAPKYANSSPLPSRSHNQIRYPPPISKIPARIKRRIVYRKHFFREMHPESI